MKLKRLFAYIIDRILVLLLSFIITAIIIASIVDSEGSEAIPFLIIMMNFFPSITSGYLLCGFVLGVIDGVRKGRIENMSGFAPYLGAILINIIVQAVILLIIELFKGGLTTGRKFMGIIVVSDNGNYTLTKSFCRNFIKSISPYLFYFPFISLIFSKNNKTIYDKLLGTSIVEINK